MRFGRIATKLPIATSFGAVLISAFLVSFAASAQQVPAQQVSAQPISSQQVPSREGNWPALRYDLPLDLAVIAAGATVFVSFELMRPVLVPSCRWCDRHP